MMMMMMMKVSNIRIKFHPFNTFLSFVLKSTALKKKKKLRGFGPLANCADRATAASWRSSANFCG
jgi:hypothetical protein